MSVDKLAQIRAFAKDGAWDLALRVAASMAHLGAQRDAILTARGASVRPGFYVELGKDPAALIEAGVAAMKERWGL